jgi:hypothetical protein
MSFAWFWGASLGLAGLLLLGLAFWMPDGVLPCLKGILLGGAFWAWVAWQSRGVFGHTDNRPTTPPARWQQLLWIILGLTGCGLIAWQLRDVGQKQWIVFAGFFVYKGGVLACAIRSSCLTNHRSS